MQLKHILPANMNHQQYTQSLMVNSVAIQFVSMAGYKTSSPGMGN